MSEQKTKIHPDARKAMARFAAEPETPRPLTKLDFRISEILKIPYTRGAEGVEFTIETCKTEYTGLVKLQVANTENGRYSIPANSDVRSMMRERYSFAMGYVRPELGAGTELLEAVSDKLQTDIASFDELFTKYKADKVSKLYINRAVAGFVNLCESLGMMNYCHKILAKHNLDI